MSNLAALKAIASRTKRTINGQVLDIRGVGTIRLAERIVEHEGVLALIQQKGVDTAVLVREFPGFVRDLAVDSLLDDDEMEIAPGAENDPRPAYRVWIESLPPTELIELGEGVVDATMPEGLGALQKKVMPLLAKFGVQIAAPEAAAA